MAQALAEVVLSDSGEKDSSPPWSLRIQRLVGWLFLIPVSTLVIGLIRYRARYRINKHSQIRAQFKKIVGQGGPLLVCANHLTMIDSVVLMWALASIPHYCMRYRHLCWNLPAVENAQKRLSWRIVTYLAKCILIDRMSPPDEAAKVIQSVSALLHQGELVMIFPEGTRSRSGRIEPSSVQYGVGKIIQATPGCRVLCVYMRGKGQVTYSDFPRKNETFDLVLEIVTPTSVHTGMRGARDISVQIGQKLKAMEDHYFQTGACVDAR